MWQVHKDLLAPTILAFYILFKKSSSYTQVMFPSALLGTGENWTLAKTISATEYLNYESGTALVLCFPIFRAFFFFFSY
jgi:ABC-type maltose transport system permease subunit